jgi:hypothetical protein
MALAVGVWLAAVRGADEPPALDPFGPRSQARDDAMPGYLELSDGTVRPGLLYLTREHRLKVFDEKEERQRLIPLQAVRRIHCTVVKEWREKEWRFKENANDEKVFTGRSYPAREYVHVVTLANGKTIRGPLAAIVYVQAEGADEPERFLLHKRDKGEPGTDLKDLVYVRTICLGEKALEEGKRKAQAGR